MWAGGATALAVVAAGVGAALTAGGDGGSADNHLAERAGGLSGPVFSVGTTVYLDGGAQSAVIADKAVKSMYYTSAGVLVRHGNNPYSDGGGPMRFSLVSPTAEVQPLDVTFEETVPSTDPDEPYLAYAEVVDGVVDVVLVDVRDGSEAARVAVPDVEEWGGWAAPPVSLDGDVVYLGSNDATYAVDWRSSAVTSLDSVDGFGPPDVRSGHGIVYDGSNPSVVEVLDGSTLLTAEKDEFLMLSPDGRYALGQVYDSSTLAARVVDLSTGTSVPLDIEGNGVGWSPDNDIFAVNGTKLTSCPAETGACTTTRLDLAVAPDDNGSKSFEDDLKMGGATYES
jgi:hypothetical protein